MCGLVCVKRKDGKPAYKAVLKRYRHQKTRGQSGFGYVAVKDDLVVSYQRAETEQEIVKLIEKETAPEIWFHHRFPTSTPNITEAAHPILVATDKLDHQYYVLHNGVISNSKDLREKHYERGITYSTEIIKGFTAVSTGKVYQNDVVWNDSESLAVETALAMEGKKYTIATEGAAAVIGLKVIGDRVIERFFYRNDHHPLMFHEDKQMTTLTTLGSGTLVPDTMVHKLDPHAGFSRYGDGIAVPKSFTYKNFYGSRDAEFYRTHKWDNISKSYVPIEDKTHTLTLNGLVKSPIGFSQPYTDADNLVEDSINFGPEDDNDMDGYKDDPIPAFRRLGEIARELNVMEKRLQNGGMHFVEQMTVDTLWEEFNDAADIEKTLKETVDEMDNFIKDGEPNEQMYNERENIETRRNRISDYVTTLGNEINIREAMQERMSK